MTGRLVGTLSALVLLLEALILFGPVPEAKREPAPLAVETRGSATPPEALRPHSQGRDRVWTVRPPSFWSAMALPTSRAHPDTWVDERVDRWRVRGGETAFDKVGFASNLRQALMLARQHRKLVFLLVDRGSVFKCRA